MRTKSKKYNRKLKELGNEIGIGEKINDILNNENESKRFIDDYMKKMGYKETNTISKKVFKIKNNEVMRLVNASIFLFKRYGIVYFLKKVKLKIKYSLS